MTDSIGQILMIISSPRMTEVSGPRRRVRGRLRRAPQGQRQERLAEADGPARMRLDWVGRPVRLGQPGLRGRRWRRWLVVGMPWVVGSSSQGRRTGSTRLSRGGSGSVAGSVAGWAGSPISTFPRLAGSSSPRGGG